MDECVGRIELVVGLPGVFTGGERMRFHELVANAGEVAGAALTANIENARVLVMLKHEGVVHGVAALKRPQESYRKKVMQQAAVALPASDFPYEFGYVYIEPNLQGRGLSHRLVSEALAHSDGAAVFATVRIDNAAMRATLSKAGFTALGQSYSGLNNRRLGLLLRKPV